MQERLIVNEKLERIQRVRRRRAMEMLIKLYNQKETKINAEPNVSEENKARYQFLIDKGYLKVTSESYNFSSDNDLFERLVVDIEFTFKTVWYDWIETRPRSAGCEDRSKRKILIN